MINELNNNSIFPAKGKKTQLPDSIVDTKTDIGRIPGLYKNDDGYRPYTIYGNPGEFSIHKHKNFFPSNFLVFSFQLFDFFRAWNFPTFGLRHHFHWHTSDGARLSRALKANEAKRSALKCIKLDYDAFF